MFRIKSLLIVPFGVLTMGSVSVEASMLDQVIYNVVGQVANATGARLGDEIYYGSSKSTKKRTKRKRKKSRTKPIPQDTPEMQVQKALASLGFYRGRIDGLVNSYETRSAIKAMNIAYNISNTSSLTPETKDSLIYLGTLFGFDRCLASQKNDKRSKGRKIQTSLKIHGFYFTRIDGIVGSGTRKSIADYKMAKSLSAGASLDFEEEYQLLNTAKQLNDKNIDETIHTLQSLHFQRPAMQQRQVQSRQYNQVVNSTYMPQQQTTQYSQPQTTSSSHIQQGQYNTVQYRQNTLPSNIQHRKTEQTQAQYVPSSTGVEGQQVAPTYLPQTTAQSVQMDSSHIQQRKIEQTQAQYVPSVAGVQGKQVTSTNSQQDNQVQPTENTSSSVLDTKIVQTDEKMSVKVPHIKYGVE